MERSAFRQVLQSPRTHFTVPELAACSPELDNKGCVQIRGIGGYGQVGKLKAPSGQCFAIKTFHHIDSPCQLLDLERVSRRLLELSVPCLVRYEFFRSGIMFQGQSYPCIKMPWLETSLPDFLTAQLPSLRFPARDGLEHLRLVLAGLGQTPVEKLLHGWFQSCGELHRRGISLSDCHHNNTFVMPNFLPKHIDLDGTSIIGITRQSIGELGFDGYRHPRRIDRQVSPEIFNFPAWVIFLSLSVAVADPDLFRQLFNPDAESLCGLTQADYDDPPSSAVFKLLLQSRSSAVRHVTPLVMEFCNREYEEVPQLMEQNLGFTLPRVHTEVTAAVAPAAKRHSVSSSPVPVSRPLTQRTIPTVPSIAAIPAAMPVQPVQAAPPATVPPVKPLNPKPPPQPPTLDPSLRRLCREMRNDAWKALVESLQALRNACA
jgi:hypothetical protein